MDDRRGFRTFDCDHLALEVAVDLGDFVPADPLVGADPKYLFKALGYEENNSRSFKK